MEIFKINKGYPPSTYPSGDISSEHNENTEKILDTIIDATSVLTIITSLFIIYLIFYKSPALMSTYKKYLLLNVLLEIWNVIISSLGKPRVLFGLFIGFTTGLFPIHDGLGTILIFVFWTNAVIWSSTCLILIHIERYYSLHRVPWENSSRLNPRFFAYTYVILNTLTFLVLIISGIAGDVFIHGLGVSNYLEEIGGGEDFLRKYPGTILLNNQGTVWVLVYYSFLILSSIYIVIPLFTFLLLNAFTGFKAINSTNYSLKIKQIHNTLLQASIFQVILLFIFGTIPVIFFLVSLIAETSVINMGVMQCVLHFYPLSDNIVILFFVKPYRDFILSYLRKNSVSDGHSVP